MDLLNKNDSPNLASLMKKLSKSELTSILELLQNKASGEIRTKLSNLENTLNSIFNTVHVMSEYDLMYWYCNMRLLTTTLQQSEEQVLAKLKNTKSSYCCTKCKKNVVINYNMGVVANLQCHSCNTPPASLSGATPLDIGTVKKLKEYELYQVVHYDNSMEEKLFYKVVVNPGKDIVYFYSIVYNADKTISCLVCDCDVSGKVNVIQHVLGNMHKKMFQDDYSFILIFHTYFSNLEPKYQVLLSDFHPIDERKAECLICSNHIRFQNVKKHMGGPCFKVSNDLLNDSKISNIAESVANMVVTKPPERKIKNTSTKPSGNQKCVSYKYDQLVENTIYKGLLEYNVLVDNVNCLMLQNIESRIYCLLCNANVTKHICIHIDSIPHQQNLSNGHTLQMLKKFHQIWTVQPVHIQIEQIYFRRREHKITCTVCSNFFPYNASSLTQHVESIEHKRFLMKVAEFRTSSLDQEKLTYRSVSSRSTSTETDGNISLSTSSSSSNILNRTVMNSSIVADVLTPSIPNSPITRNLSETFTLVPYDKSVLDELYPDGLMHFTITVGSMKYPTIIKREASKYCLLCNVDITTTVLLHANSPQHIESMGIDHRRELLKKFHDIWISLPQIDQCRQVLFKTEEDLICSLCNQGMAYDVNQVRSHIESWEHVQKLMVTQTNGSLDNLQQHAIFSEDIKNDTISNSPRKIDKIKICEEKSSEIPTEKPKSLQDLLEGLKISNITESKPNVAVTKTSENKIENSSIKSAGGVAYSKEVLDELYGEELIHYHIRVDNIKYPFIQNMGTYKRCLICNIDLMSSILFHINSPPHVAMTDNPERIEQLKNYHDLWLNFSGSDQREQKYFDIGEKLTCSPCEKELDYNVEALTAHIVSTGHDNETWLLNNKSSTGLVSEKLSNTQLVVKEEIPHPSKDLIDFDFDDSLPVTEVNPTVDELNEHPARTLDLVTGSPPAHESQLNTVAKPDSQMLYIQSVLDAIYFDLMHYTVVLNNSSYLYIQRRLHKFYCLICRTELDSYSIINPHCMGTKHRRRLQQDGCLEILVRFHEIFMRLPSEQQMQQIFFKPSGNKITCLPCCKVFPYLEQIQKHLGTDKHFDKVERFCNTKPEKKVKAKKNAQNGKRTINEKALTPIYRSYPEAIMEIIYANLQQYTININGLTYLCMQNRIETEYCLLCQKPVAKVVEHIESEEHSNNQKNIKTLQLVQRFHVLFLNVAEQLQFNQIHFKPQPNSVHCLKCLSSCSTTSELTQHLQSDRHYQLIAMGDKDDNLRSLEEIDESPSNTYTKKIMNTIYANLTQYSTGINNFLYPYIQHRSQGFYCLICQETLALLSDIDAHNSSDKHVDKYMDLPRLQMVSRYHEVFTRLSPEHQAQQIYFELHDNQMVCLPCATFCPYLREFVREHLTSAEHYKQLAMYKASLENLRSRKRRRTANSQEINPVYRKAVIKTVYKDLQPYTVTTKNFKFPYIQNRGWSQYCLMCKKQIENVRDHIISDEHLVNEDDKKIIESVMNYHNLFLPLKGLQHHQVYFKPEIQGVRCLKCNFSCLTYPELEWHIKTDEHKKASEKDFCCNEPNLVVLRSLNYASASVEDGINCSLPTTYPKSVRKIVYKNLKQYTVAIGNENYFYIQNRGATQYCLICKIQVQNVSEHIRSAEHLTNQSDDRVLEAVKRFHDLFLSLKNELLIQQIYFMPEKDGVRCLKCELSCSTSLLLTVHVESDLHKSLYVTKSEEKCNTANDNCAKTVGLCHTDLLIERSHGKYCIVCERNVGEDHLSSKRHIKMYLSSKESKKDLTYFNKWNELEAAYKDVRKYFLPASSTLTFCLKCGLNVEYCKLENHLIQFHNETSYGLSEKLDVNFRPPTTRYPQSILHMYFKSNIPQCNIIVNSFSYPVLLNMAWGLFCLLCRTMLEEDIITHLTSESHLNIIFESGTSIRKFLRYHDIWTAIDTKYQPQIMHFNILKSYLFFCTLCDTHFSKKKLKLHLESPQHVSALEEFTRASNDTNLNEISTNMRLTLSEDDHPKESPLEMDALAEGNTDLSKRRADAPLILSRGGSPKKQRKLRMDSLQDKSDAFDNNYSILIDGLESEPLAGGSNVVEDDYLPGHPYPRIANDFARKLHHLDVDIMQSTSNGKLFCLLCQTETNNVIAHTSLVQHETKASNRSADIEFVRIFHKEWRKVDILKRWLEATFFPVSSTVAFCKKCGFNVEYSCLNSHLTRCHDNLLDIDFQLKLDEDFHFTSKKEYSVKVQKTLYKDNIPQCNVILEDVSYPVIQTLGVNLRCLLCRKEIVGCQFNHLNSTEHISTATNVVSRKRLKSYHDTWLDGDEAFQMQQIYFEKDRDFYCKICVLDLKAAELREHIMSNLHTVSLNKFLINERLLNKPNIFHDIEITPQLETNKIHTQSPEHSHLSEQLTSDSETEDSDDDPRNYPESLLEEYYPDFNKYYLTMDNIRYPIFRNTVAGCVCMICKRNPRISSIEVHIEKDSHKSRMTNLTRQTKLQRFHGVWMKQNYSVQQHQKYFNQSKCLTCNLLVDYDNIAAHVQSELHLLTANSPLNLSLSEIGDSKESLNASFNVSNSSTPVKRQSIQNVNSAVNLSRPLGATAAASKSKKKELLHNIKKSILDPNSSSIVDKIPLRYSNHAKFLIIDNMNNIFCKCCSKKLKDDMINIKEHLDNANHLSLSRVPKKKMKYFCEVCNKHYSMESSWDNHLIDLTHTARFNNLGKTRKERITEYECSTCSLVIYGDEISLQRHNAVYQRKKTKELTLPKPVIHLLSSKSFIDENSKKLLTEASKASHNQEKERQVCVALVKVLKEVFPMCKAYPFGSRVTGLGYCDSDLDVFLDTGDMYQGNHHQGAEEQANIVNIVAKTLQKHKLSFSDINKVAGARTPIVQVFHKDSNIDCDISFRHGLSVENTAFISLCLDLQTILRPTMLYLKEWYVATNISGLSSYALTMLMIFYLQTTGYLLSVRELRLINAEKGTVIDGWESIKYTTSLQKMREFVNRCDYNVDQLMGNFFEYYAKFDFDKWVICPLMGYLVAKTQFNGNGIALPPEMAKYVQKLNATDPEYFRNLTPMCVQDPFDLSHNLTKAFSKDMLKKFQAYCGLSKNHLSALN